jgi:hypothetical protein
MVVKCLVKDCKFNTNNMCTKDEIEIWEITTCDEENPECMDYEEN